MRSRRNQGPLHQSDVKFADAELQGCFVVGHEDINTIVKAFRLAVLDYAFAEALDDEPCAERDGAWPCGCDPSGGHLAIGRGLTGPAAAFCAMAIGCDCINPGPFVGMGRQG